MKLKVFDKKSISDSPISKNPLDNTKKQKNKKNPNKDTKSRTRKPRTSRKRIKPRTSVQTEKDNFSSFYIISYSLFSQHVGILTSRFS